MNGDIRIDGRKGVKERNGENGGREKRIP